jgi:FtsZ-interacting cell division protein ZipA
VKVTRSCKSNARTTTPLKRMNSCVEEEEEDDYFCENTNVEPQSPPSAATTAEEDDDEPISYRNHLIDVTNITYPIILAEIFQNTLPLIDLAFVGMYYIQYNINAFT